MKKKKLSFTISLLLLSAILVGYSKAEAVFSCLKPVRQAEQGGHPLSSAAVGKDIDILMDEIIADLNIRLERSRDLQKKTAKFPPPMRTTEEDVRQRQAKLDEAKAGVARIRAAMQQPTVSEFMRVLADPKTDVLPAPTDVQERAISILEELVQKDEIFKLAIDRREIFFVPPQTWMAEMLRLKSNTAAAIYQIADRLGNSSFIIIVSAQLQELFEILKALVHEEAHKKYRPGKLKVLAENPDEIWLYDVLHEAAVEENCLQLTREAELQYPEVRDSILGLEAARQLLSDGGEPGLVITLFLDWEFAAYAVERGLLDAVRSGWEDEDENEDEDEDRDEGEGAGAIELFLLKGDSSALQGLLGKTLKKILSIANSKMVGLGVGRHIAVHIITQAVRELPGDYQKSEAVLDVGLVFLDILEEEENYARFINKESDGEYPSERELNIHQRCVFRAARRVLDDLIENDRLDRDSAESEFGQKMPDYIREEVAELVSALAGGAGEVAAAEATSSPSRNHHIRISL